MKEQFIDRWTKHYPEQIKVRLEKRRKMEEEGSLPYKNGLKPNSTGTELKAKYNHLAKEEIGETPDFKMAGRAILVRDFGKAAFIQLDDGTERFQVYVKKGVVDDAGFAE